MDRMEKSYLGLTGPLARRRAGTERLQLARFITHLHDDRDPFAFFCFM